MADMYNKHEPEAARLVELWAASLGLSGPVDRDSIFAGVSGTLLDRARAIDCFAMGRAAMARHRDKWRPEYRDVTITCGKAHGATLSEESKVMDRVHGPSLMIYTTRGMDCGFGGVIVEIDDAFLAALAGAPVRQSQQDGSRLPFKAIPVDGLTVRFAWGAWANG